MTRISPEVKVAGPPRSESGDAADDRTGARFVLQLYVAGSNPRSLKAVENLRRILERHMPGQYELRVVDIYRSPDAAEESQIVAAPTLVKELPLPLRRVVGDLADEGQVLIALGVPIQP